MTTGNGRASGNGPVGTTLRRRAKLGGVKLLPDYQPPNAQRAELAAGAAPLVVLLTFTLIVARLIEPDTGFAIFLTCTLWLGWEMHDYQRRIDAYNATYVRAHLAWRTSEALLALVGGADAHPRTRAFVEGFVAAGRVLRREGPRR